MTLSDDVRDIPRLVADAAEQFGKLIRNESQLAQAELSQKAIQAGMGVAYMAGAAMLAVPVLVLLLIALALWFVQLGLSPALAHLIAAGIGLLASVVLGIIGKSYLTPENLTPSVTLRQVDKDMAAAKEMAR
jgi:putative superfamily III holin-X